MRESACDNWHSRLIIISECLAPVLGGGTPGRGVVIGEGFGRAGN